MTSIQSSDVTTAQTSLPSNQLPVGGVLDDATNIMRPWQQGAPASSNGSGPPRAPGAVAGNVASGSTDVGNPVKTGGVYNASPQTLTTGQRSDTQMDASGNTLVSEKNSAAILADLATLAAAVSGGKMLTTETYSASILADLATLAGAISTGRMLITPPSNTNVTEVNSASILSDLATIASAISGGRMLTTPTNNASVNLTEVNGAALSTSNPVPVNSVAIAGEVALYGSNPTALTANTDAAIKWGASGTTAVNHIEIYNGWTGNVNVRLDAATTAGSAVIAPGQTKFYDVAGTLAVHLQANGTPNLNGSSSGNIVVTGWL